MEERMWAAVLVAMVENMNKDVLHDMFVNDMSAKEAQMIVDGVQWARELLAQR